MKKLYIAALAALICAPAFAQQGPQSMQQPPAFEAQEMKAGVGPQDEHAAFEKARGEHWAQMRANEEKMQKLVAEYNKLKKGKKKEAKLAEIRAEVAAVHAKRLEFMRGQLDQFERRLEGMREGLAKQEAPETQNAWIEKHTQKLIESNGDMKVLFKPEFEAKKHMDKRGFGGPQKGPRKEGKCKECGCKGRGPVAELPVERPKDR